MHTGKRSIPCTKPWEILPWDSEEAHQSSSYYNVKPDYGFRDLNVKYSGSGKRSNYYLSLYGGKDHFSYSFKEEITKQDSLTLISASITRRPGGRHSMDSTGKKKIPAI